MPVRVQVLDAQRAVVALELNYRHVADRLKRPLARRADVLTDKDRLVAPLQAAPGQGSPGPSSYAAGAPVSDFQEALDVAAVCRSSCLLTGGRERHQRPCPLLVRTRRGGMATKGRPGATEESAKAYG